jgi:hypothetical protein
LDGCCFLFRRFPGLPIDAGSSFASVFRHSSDSKSLAAQRVGEQALQSFDLAPLASLSCLRDTGLEPTNVPLSLSPVDLVPSEGYVGGRTNRGV